MTVFVLALVLLFTGQAFAFEPVPYRNPGLVVDLEVGLWAIPLPMDFDGDGDFDMVVSTVNKASPGVYLFENTEGNVLFPVFGSRLRLGEGKDDATVSYLESGPMVCVPGHSFPNFQKTLFASVQEIPFKPEFYRGRADQWKYLDYDGDGVRDLLIGASDWREYGWDDAYDADGKWTNGPLRGYVYFVRNEGTDAEPVYGSPLQLMAGDRPVDVFGCPSPNFSDWDGDGDLDLVCGEFLDKLTWFENTGTRAQPRYAPGRFLRRQGETIRMDLQMLQVVAMDWDRDGDEDLVVGEEDGRVSLLECVGVKEDGAPDFLPPRYFKQKADYLKCGVLTTPSSYDWDGDGDEDLICGDTAGYLRFIENLDGGNPPSWAEPVKLKADGRTIRIMAGPNGSIQGPAEAKWGYTCPWVADWNHDGLPDIIANSIWGKVVWFENNGSRTEPNLKAAQRVRVDWDGPPRKPEWNWWDPEEDEFVTQWRTTPAVLDLNRDGLNDLVMLDHEGYLAFFERRRKNGDELILAPGRRIFLDEENQPLRLNERRAGKSGRRKFVLADWDQDGDLDILINGKNADLLRNVGQGSEYRFVNEGPVDERVLAGHTTCPTVVDWDGNGAPDLLVGAEDGFLYYHRNPHAPSSK